MISTSSLLISLGTSFSCLFLLIITLVVLSSNPANAAINNRRANTTPTTEGEEKKNFFKHAVTILMNVVGATEKEIVRDVGIDSAVYLYTLNTCEFLCDYF